MEKFLTILTTFFYVMVVACFIALAIGAPTMWLWNAVMPSIFGLTRITFWQAVALNLLCSILFGHFSTGGDK